MEPPAWRRVEKTLYLDFSNENFWPDHNALSRSSNLDCYHILVLPYVATTLTTRSPVPGLTRTHGSVREGGEAASAGPGCFDAVPCLFAQ
jgi:hypothetical protein